MQTSLGILRFMSRIHFVLSWVESEKRFIIGPEFIIICLIFYFDADFLWKVGLKILNSGIILKPTHVLNLSLGFKVPVDKSALSLIHSLVWSSLNHGSSVSFNICFGCSKEPSPWAYLLHSDWSIPKMHFWPCWLQYGYKTTQKI